MWSSKSARMRCSLVRGVPSWKNRINVFNQFDRIKVIVESIDVESYVVTISDYGKVSKLLY